MWLGNDTIKGSCTTLAENGQWRSLYMFVVSGLPPEMVRIIFYEYNA